jgi:hypothetical protein
LFIVLFYFAVTVPVKAQMKLVDNDGRFFKQKTSLHFFNSLNTINNNVSLLNYSMISPQNKSLTINSGSINDLPFFCAMECKVRKHTNIWIKLRAGDDASYMRMIKSTSK